MGVVFGCKRGGGWMGGVMECWKTGECVEGSSKFFAFDTKIWYL